MHIGIRLERHCPNCDIPSPCPLKRFGHEAEQFDSLEKVVRTARRRGFEAQSRTRQGERSVRVTCRNQVVYPARESDGGRFIFFHMDRGKTKHYE